MTDIKPVMTTQEITDGAMADATDGTIDWNVKWVRLDYVKSKVCVMMRPNNYAWLNDENKKLVDENVTKYVDEVLK